MRPFLAVILVALSVGWTAVANTYRDEVNAYRAKRDGEIRGPGGWASLVDLHWVTPGRYTLAKAATNARVLAAPSAPATIGVLTVTATGATLEVDPAVVATVHGRPVRSTALTVNGEADQAIVIGQLSMVVIRRG